jgi:D-alanyl-D-alanine carboxypeptidase
MGTLLKPEGEIYDMKPNRQIKYKRRQFITFLVILSCILSILQPANQAKAAKKPVVYAHAYVIMDANSGKILFSQNATKKIYPASTVKLMTALVTLDHLKINKKVKVTKKALKTIPRSASKVGLRSGSVYTVDALLHMLLLPSAADAAAVLAKASCGSQKSFISEMNKKAKQLGLSHTSFDNPIGLDIGDHYYRTYTTAKEFTAIARFASCNPTIRSIISTAYYRVPKAKGKASFVIRNTNSFLTSFSYNHKLYQMIGGKTGTTRAAGAVLITSAKDTKGHEIICAFFGNRGRAQSNKDIKKLLDYTFKQGKQGKLDWTKGYWDVRYRDSNDIIQKYYNKGLLPVSNQFYPTKKASQESLIDMLNTLTNASYQAIDADKKMSLLTLAHILYDDPLSEPTPTETTEPNDSHDENTYTSNSDDTTDENRVLCSSYIDYATMTDEDCAVLASMIKNHLIPASLGKKGAHNITKEELVLIADLLNQL